MSDGANLWCPRCRKPGVETGSFCSLHTGEELVPVPDTAVPGTAGSGATGPGTAGQGTAGPGSAGREERRTTCWDCGTPVTDARNDTCVRCHQPLAPPALVIRFATGTVVLRTRGTSAELGRAGEFRHVFANFPNVSRRHATVSADAAGSAWLTPFPEAPNGTFVNGREIHERTQVRQSDQIRFATDRPPLVGPISDSISQPDLAG